MKEHTGSCGQCRTPTRDLNLSHPASYRPLLTCPKTISVRAATRGVPLSRADSGSKLVAKFLS